MFRGRWFGDGIVGVSPALLGGSVVVGVASGAVGAAYLLALHGLQHALGPERWGNVAQIGVLAAAGAAVS